MTWQTRSLVPGPGWRRRAWRRGASAAALLLCLHPVASLADSTMDVITGVPQQIVPLNDEVGLGDFVFTPGQVTLLGGSGSTGGTGGGGDGSGDGGGGTPAGPNAALDEMQGTSWGAQASQSATLLGVDPSAVATACMVESQCGGLPLGSRGDIFQMSPATYNQEIAEALAAHPELAGSIVPGSAGRLDPATDAIAAAQYLKDGAAYLKNHGVADPNNLAVRGYYNFGPVDGAYFANASDTDSITAVLAHLDPSNYKGDGITPGETVGQWRAATSAKMGGIANQSVLL